MEGEGRVTTALAEATGRPCAIASLTSATSGPALRAAAADWTVVHDVALAWEERAGRPPPRQPRDVTEAADRLLEVLVTARRAGAHEANGGASRAAAPTLATGQTATQHRSLRDLPADST
eukprot:2826616-Pleurochrysis_carterae.AAC.1